MAPTDSTDRPATDRSSRTRRPLLRGGPPDRARFDDGWWLAAGVLSATLVYTSYLWTHEYPAYGAGLFLQIAEQIRTGGYALPAFVQGYTAGGVPFAYPPVGFYVAAVVQDLTGITPVAYARVVPGLLLVATVVPYYGVAKRLLDSRRLAGIATILFVSTPAVLRWHLSAGGMVRTMALLFALTGIYVGVRLFESGNRRWIVPGAVLFGLTVLTHPTYTVFFVVTYLLLFVRDARSLRGLVSGAAVAAGGLLVATPWLLQVVGAHGMAVFTAAAGTHSGLGGGLERVYSVFVTPLAPDPETIFFVAAFAGALYALRKKRIFLPAWLVVAGYVVGKHRFLFVPGAMLTAVVIVEVVAPAFERAIGRPAGRSVRTVVVVGLLVASLGIGVVYAGGGLSPGYGDSSPSQPAFIDEHDREAMAWAANNTSPSAQFVVLGDAAEWFPLFSDRTILVGPWGVEWTTAERYEYQLSFYRSISTCSDAACLTASLTGSEFAPDYVYVPRDQYTVRGQEHTPDAGMRDSMIAADEYRLVYENEGVMVFEVTESGPADVRLRPAGTVR